MGPAVSELVALGLSALVLGQPVLPVPPMTRVASPSMLKR